MEERAFSRKCGKCRQRAVAIESIAYSIQIDHDGRKYPVTIPALTVPRCSNCQTIAIDAEADRQIDEAFRREAKLLTGNQIRENRLRFGLKQEELADLLGISVSTLSRWETGAQVQQRCMDKLLRAFFEVPEVRQWLGRADQIGRAHV